MLPDALWIAAKRFKSGLGQVRAELADEGFCSRTEATQTARMILYDNDARLDAL